MTKYCNFIGETLLACIFKKGLRQFDTKNVCRVNTFLETWKCQGIRQRSGKSQEKGPKSAKGQGICAVREIWWW